MHIRVKWQRGRLCRIYRWHRYYTDSPLSPYCSSSATSTAGPCPNAHQTLAHCITSRADEPVRKPGRPGPSAPEPPGRELHPRRS
ncbi:unnamed protein product [Ixodes pacificus]